MNDFYDVIIIGGGPAGSASAIHLRKAGLKVILFEKEKFPRAHVGESLVPFCYELFDELGILEELQKTAVRKPGVRFINKDGSKSTTYCFKNILDGPNQMSFHVLREKFDKQLLDRAQKLGTVVHEQHRVTNVNLDKTDEVEVTVSNPNNEKSTVKGKFLIDATGQDSFLAKKLKSKEKHKDLDRIAFLSHWNCDTSKEGVNEGLLQLLYLSDSKKGWMGIQPVDVNRLSVGLICDNNYVKQAKAKYAADGIENWKEQFYVDQVLSSPFTKDLLANAKMINKLLVVGDYSYKITKKFGSNYALVGDAAGFLDPIFATGVYLALNTAKNTANAIVRQLTEGKDIGQKELAASYTQYEGALELLEKFINNFYNPEFVNLAEIQSDVDSENNENHTKSMIAFSIVHFLMGGDFYNEHKKYLEYLDFLSQPKQLARYYHLVINQPKYKENSCDYLMEDVFPMLNDANLTE